RVVALSRPTDPSDDDIGADLDLWESTLRRSGWRQPLVADLDDHVYTVVQADGDRPGSWAWLADHVRSPQLTSHSGTRACAGSKVGVPADLAGSRAAAAELASLIDVDDVTPTTEDRWVDIAAARAVSALGAPDRFGGPVPVLREHDGRVRGTRSAYLPSLAAWLDHPGEPSVAARALGVHVNTLRHRMVRMSEVADLPLDDPVACTVLRLQLAALGY
ncbi:MAG: helix-turn-helix domain-containing protein, partial [Actinomycetota bacterium]|nr:helix-turn-helix domain-containing protein [Actinomycetota bacterium]